MEQRIFENRARNTKRAHNASASSLGFFLSSSCLCSCVCVCVSPSAGAPRTNPTRPWSHRISSWIASTRQTNRVARVLPSARKCSNTAQASTNKRVKESNKAPTARGHRMRQYARDTKHPMRALLTRLKNQSKTTLGKLQGGPGEVQNR